MGDMAGHPHLPESASASIVCEEQIITAVPSTSMTKLTKLSKLDAKMGLFFVVNRPPITRRNAK
jgi:hypothetical protein